MERAQAQSWFPANAVTCSLSGDTINLGVFSRIRESTSVATGDWGVDCRSNAYPQGYPKDYDTVEGGYCVVIGNPDSRIGERVLRGEGKNSNVTIPFNFYFSRQKPFGGYEQDYETPIGDGIWGIAYIDWNYRDGNRRGRRPPVQVNPYYSLPGRGRFDLKISAPPGGRVYPAGFYSASFPFRWKTGEVRTANSFPRPAEGPNICSRFPGGGGSGTINVRMEIKKYCNIAVKNSIDFGKQAFLGKTLTTEGQIAVECSNGTKFAVGINYGLNSEGTSQRAMRLENGREKISYEIYQDPGMTRPWQNTWGDASVMRGTGSAEDQLFSVYAAVKPQDNKPAGIYKDTLIVEVRVIDTGWP